MRNLLTFTLSLLLSIPGLSQTRNLPALFLKAKKKKIETILEAGNFHPGDQIADVGAGNGWIAAAIGIYEDSLTFYLEDIDSSHLVKNDLQEALEEYTKEKGSPITCFYTSVIGTATSTTLPDSAFDKVLLIDTYHHLEFKNEMILDLFRILKPGGKLIVYEPLAGKSGEVYKMCKSNLHTSNELISFLREKGFELEAMYDSGRSAGKKVRTFVFGRW